MPESDAAERAIADYADHPGPLRLRGAVQHYDWGGYTFIPNLLGVANPDHEPYAELWIGANASAPSTAEVDGVSVPLDRLVAQAPQRLLGPDTAARFEQKLPYLYKVLDAHKMLSIQAHPTKKQAEEGFARENAEGISPKAPNRNYKDDNHKPEVHVALTDFWMLHGFQPVDQIAQALDSVPELRALMPDFRERLGRGDDREALRALYERVMTMPQDEVDGFLNPLIARLQAERPSDKDAPDFWALRAAENFPLPDGHRDRGIFSIYLLNLVHLKPGQGTYQPAGMLHAYLEGVNMELMANSDNVLRGGLTPKHVDVPELMRTLTFESGPTHVLDGEQVSDTERVYRTSAREFELTRIDLVDGVRNERGAEHGPDTLIVMEGAAVARSGDQAIDMARGQILFAPHGLPYTLEPKGGPAVVFRAAVPKPA